MKKKFIAFTGAGALLIAAGVVFVSAQNDNIDSASLLEQNIEALGRAESEDYSCDAPYTKYCSTEGGYDLPGVKK